MVTTMERQIVVYARWSSSDYYIFRETVEAERKEDERLAIWHHESDTYPSFSYDTILEILNERDFSIIPGFKACDEDILTLCLTAFIDEVKAQYARQE